MAKKKKIKGKKKKSASPIYVSPDGGHTVYQQMRNNQKKLIEEDIYARALREVRDDSEMFGIEAWDLRQQYPSLQKAYDQYKTIYRLVYNEEE